MFSIKYCGVDTNSITLLGILYTQAQCLTMDTVGDVFWLVIVAILWGGTNPLLKKGGQGIERIEAENLLKRFVLELKFLVLNWKYILPFLLNQCGSVVFYLTLSSADLSLAVPITNSLTFIFTGLSGKLLGEKFGNKETYTGMTLVIIGIIFCVSSKS
ncbi:hypothetical protein LSH36_228g03039 [Paralvinella palmiformis]|uniref:Transmembrane protein 234 n=1 Tax=Paralvinella palmiformis TaxID=53620 RepID=A0AAD9N3L1_9ANNE|nr:hypothetical protein LSH36_228g03039 [Paralvinella palmiformis]